jgi:hypothetical protein
MTISSSHSYMNVRRRGKMDLFWKPSVNSLLLADVIVIHLFRKTTSLYGKVNDRFYMCFDIDTCRIFSRVLLWHKSCVSTHIPKPFCDCDLYFRICWFVCMELYGEVTLLEVIYLRFWEWYLRLIGSNMSLLTWLCTKR